MGSVRQGHAGGWLQAVHRPHKGLLELGEVGIGETFRDPGYIHNLLRAATPRFCR